MERRKGETKGVGVELTRSKRKTLKVRHFSDQH